MHVGAGPTFMACGILGVCMADYTLIRMPMGSIANSWATCNCPIDYVEWLSWQALYLYMNRLLCLNLLVICVVLH